MANTYKFVLDASQPLEVSWEECSTHCCNTQYDPIDDYRCRLKNRLDSKGLHYEDDLLLPPGGFGESGDLNPFEIIREMYMERMQKDLEICLSRKLNMHDCVFGCYSGIVKRQGLLCHRHQWCARMKQFKHGFDNMENTLISEVEKQTFQSFEDFISYLNEMMERDMKNKGLTGKKGSDYFGFGGLSVYDTALRFAWHAWDWKTPETDAKLPLRKDLLPEKVYLHQGARWGSDHLFNLGLLSDLDGLKNLNKITSLSRKHYPSALASLDAFHLENLLCIFHSLFAKWDEMMVSETTNL